MESNHDSSTVYRLWQRMRDRIGVHAYGLLAALVGTVLVWALFFIPGEKPEPLVVYAWVGATPESVSRAQAEEDVAREKAIRAAAAAAGAASPTRR